MLLINEMNTPKKILIKSSKQLCLEAARKAASSEVFFKELYSLSLSEESPYNWRASWSLLYLSESEPQRILPYLREIADHLPEIKNHTQLGSFLRIFDAVNFDVEEFGDLLDFCLHLIKTPQKREYVKVISIQIIEKFSKAYPELNEEIIEQIKLASPHFEKPFLKKKAKDVILRLQKLKT